MAEPTRIRAAAVVMSLAGSEGTDSAAFTARDRALADRVRSRLRAAGDRRRVAEAIVAERFAVSRVSQGACLVAPAAILYARWMRSMDAVTRERVARSLDDASTSAIAPHVRSASQLDEPERKLTAWLIATGARALGHMPTAVELASLLDALRGGSDVAAPGLVRWERALRVAGRRDACEDLARAIAGET